VRDCDPVGKGWSNGRMDDVEDGGTLWYSGRGRRYADMGQGKVVENFCGMPACSRCCEIICQFLIALTAVFCCDYWCSVLV